MNSRIIHTIDTSELSQEEIYEILNVHSISYRKPYSSNIEEYSYMFIGIMFIIIAIIDILK